MKKFKKFMKENYKVLLGDIIILLVVVFALFYKFPFVIYKPGGIINVTDRITIDGVNNKEKGTYNLSYVSSVNGNTPNMILGLILKDWEIIPIEEVEIDGFDYEESLRIGRYEFQNAIETATIVAYQKAGKEVEVTGESLLLYGLDPKADTTLKILDEILKIDGKSITTAEEIRSLMASKNVGDIVTFDVIRDGKEASATAKVYNNGEMNLVGIMVLEKPEFKVTPSIQIETKQSEAGSSGGFMTALAIYDALIEEDLTHGKTIVGTGTIDLEGNIGEIGGIKYKLLGAANSGADIFLVPKANYKEAKKVWKEYKLEFELVEVATFDEAITYLNSIK